MDLRSIERSIIAHTNLTRERYGRPRVQPKRNMNRAARFHSNHMAKVRRLGHNGIGDGTPASRARKYKCGKGNSAENVQGPWSQGYFKYYKTTEEEIGKLAVEQWMNSPGHMRNILNPSWTVLGVGAGKSRSGGVYLTQTFGPNRQMDDELLVGLCRGCKSQHIRTRKTAHQINLWRCLKCKEVFPTPAKDFRRPEKWSVLAENIPTLETQVRISDIKRRRWQRLAATSSIAAVICAICFWLVVAN